MKLTAIAIALFTLAATATAHAQSGGMQGMDMKDMKTENNAALHKAAGVVTAMSLSLRRCDTENNRSGSRIGRGRFSTCPRSSAETQLLGRPGWPRPVIALSKGLS